MLTVADSPLCHAARTTAQHHRERQRGLSQATSRLQRAEYSLQDAINMMPSDGELL
jgi:hypothetical protein